MNNTGATDYAVRVHMNDGSVRPDTPEELDWFSYNVAVRIAGKAHAARETVTGSPVVAIEIINADYETIKIVRYED